MSAWTIPSYAEWAVPGYAEERLLGHGVSGRVVAAVNEAAGQRVAIKYLDADTDDLVAHANADYQQPDADADDPVAYHVVAYAYHQRRDGCRDAHSMTRADRSADRCRRDRA